MSASISSSGRRWPSPVIQGDDRRAGDRLVALALLMSVEKSVRRPRKARLDRDVREMLGGERASFALQPGAEQHAGELADVARPAVAHQHRERVIADRQRPQPGLLAEAGKQMAGEDGNVAAPVAQRRQGDRGRADPLGQAGVEIFRQGAAGSSR